MPLKSVGARAKLYKDAARMFGVGSWMKGSGYVWCGVGVCTEYVWCGVGVCTRARVHVCACERKGMRARA